jgi:xylan 1,4-beta-xylosidase
LTLPIGITEFGPTWQFQLYDEPQENLNGASFVAQTMADIAMRCSAEGVRLPDNYTWWVLSDIFEEQDFVRAAEPFIGGMGLISREGIKKPAYNVYAFLNQLGDELVQFSVEGAGGVGGMATRAVDGSVHVLVYNGQQPGAGPVNFDNPQNDVYYTAAAATEIAIHVDGLAANVPYDVSIQRVDETHGNAYALWVQQGRPTMDAMSEADWALLRDNMVSTPEPVATAACGTAFSQVLSLSSPGVALLTLSPSR